MSQSENASPNADQIDFWNNEGGQHFIKFQSALNAMLDRYGEKTMSSTGVTEGEAVLDIGCGCGDTTMEMARRVGSEGEAIGVDISEIMLARANAVSSENGVSNTLFKLVDVETGTLPRSGFDLAFSRFGVMFFADPIAAFKNVYGALRDEGRIAFACWQPVEKNAWIGLQLKVIAPLLDAQEDAPVPDPNAPGPFSLGDPTRINEILDAAGFADIQIEHYGPDVALFGLQDIDDTVNFAMEMGPARALLDGQSDDVRSAARQAIREAYQPHLTDEGVVLSSAAWIVTAQKT